MEEIAAIVARGGISLPETVVTNSYEKARMFPMKPKLHFKGISIIGRNDEGSSTGIRSQSLGPKHDVNTPYRTANSKLSKIKMTVGS